MSCCGYTCSPSLLSLLSWLCIVSDVVIILVTARQDSPKPVTIVIAWFFLAGLPSIWQKRRNTKFLLHSIPRCLVSAMYCLQWMLPLLIMPKPVNPAMALHHSMFMTLYLLDFFISRKPCTICSAVFIIALTLLCYSGLPGCVFCGIFDSDTRQLYSWFFAIIFPTSFPTRMIINLGHFLLYFAN